jgi:hypothetical protein
MMGAGCAIFGSGGWPDGVTIPQTVSESNTASNGGGSVSGCGVFVLKSLKWRADCCF